MKVVNDFYLTGNIGQMFVSRDRNSVIFAEPAIVQFDPSAEPDMEDADPDDFVDVRITASKRPVTSLRKSAILGSKISKQGEVSSGKLSDSSLLPSDSSKKVSRCKCRLSSD
jgi:hypothetical protein